MSSLKESSAYIENMLKLRTYPLAIKFFQSSEDMIQSVPKIRMWKDRLAFCQYINLARTAGWTLGATVNNLCMADCMFMLGLAPPPEEGILDGGLYIGFWNKTQQDAAKFKNSQARIPFGTNNAVAISPVASERLETPDVLLMYGTPAQMNFMLNAAQWENYERFNFYFSGEGSCGDSLAECYNKRKLHLSVPCYGQRRFGNVQDDEMEIALPPEQLEKIVEGLMSLRKAGTAAYPITSLGAMFSPMPAITKMYPELADYIAAIDRGEFPKSIVRRKKD